MKNRLWKMLALIPFPLEQVNSIDPDAGELPLHLKWESRVARGTKFLNGTQVSIGGVERPEWWQPSHYGHIVESVGISIITAGIDASAALESVDLLLEDIIDDLSFRLQIALPIYQLEVVDITAPIAIGDEREMLLFPYPSGYKHSKFGNTIYMGADVTETRPELRVDFSALTSRDRALMRWHQKSLAATSESDRFIFLMICLEILAKEYADEVKAPYKAPCGHDIGACPECGKSIERVVNGKTLKKLLTERLGMNEALANDAWNLRQMVHGANDLTYKKMRNLPDVCRALAYSVRLGIKKRIGIPDNEPPFFSVDGPGISTQVALMMRRPIVEGDF